MIRRGSVADSPPPVLDGRVFDGLGGWDARPPVDPTGDSGRGRRGKAAALAAVAALLATVGVVVVTRSGYSGGTDGTAAGPATATAEVVRTDLVARTEVDGTLGYAGEMKVLNQVQGTVTALPRPGTVVERGGTLYSVANRPVPLLCGDLPAWRRMAQDVDGADTLQLEQNLVALGHATASEMLVDGKFTAATTTAVKRWQKAMGVEETGVVEPGQAVFLPGAIRVAEVKAEVGGTAPPGSPVLSGTSTSRVVTVDLDATRQALATVGEKVEIELPDGRTTPGTIAEVGSVATSQGQGETARRVIAVTVTPDDPAATGSLDQSPVKVGIVSDRRTGVLAVPVSALLALSEGGYGVRVLDDPTTRPDEGRRDEGRPDEGRPDEGRIVVVTTGLFARGLVEVSGDGVAEGVEVEVPAS